MLPKEKTPPRVDLSNQTILAYGPAKVGKSSFCSHADNALFLATEAGLNHLDVYQIPITTWDEFLAACKDIAAGDHPFRTIIIDTLDNSFRMCSEYVCKLHGIKHESDLPYGKGFSLTNSEFHRVLNKLSLLPYGLFLISHAQEKEVESRTGKYNRFMPSLSDKARKIVLGMCDMILFFDIEEGTDENGNTIQTRVIRTKPTKHYEAGDRSGKLPEVIDMDYGKFLAAYQIAVSDVKAKPDKNQTTKENTR